MSMHPVSNIEAAAVANAVSQERVQQTVSFPRTGDVETDCIIGFLRVAQEIGIRTEVLPRVFQYLYERYKAVQDQKVQANTFEQLLQRMKLEEAKKSIPTYVGDPLWPGYGTASPPQIGTTTGGMIPPTCNVGPGSGLAGIANSELGKTLCQVFQEEERNAKYPTRKK